MKKVSNKFLIDAKFYPISDEDKSLWNTNLTLQEITKEIYEEELTDEIKSDFQTTLIGLRLVELSGNYETINSDQLNYDQSKAYWFVYGSFVTFHNYSENVFIQMRKKIQDWFKYQHYYPISIAYQPSTTVNFAKKGVFQGSGGAVQTSTTGSDSRTISGNSIRATTRSNYSIFWRNWICSQKQFMDSERIS